MEELFVAFLRAIGRHKRQVLNGAALHRHFLILVLVIVHQVGGLDRFQRKLHDAVTAKWTQIRDALRRLRVHHRNQGCVQTQQGNSSTCASCSSVQAASDPTWGTSPNMLPRLLHSQGLSKNSAAWPTRVSNQNMVMCSCNAPFPQGLHPLGGRLGTPGGNCKSATYPHQPQESPPPPSPPPKATRAPYILHTNKTFTGEKSLSYPLLAPCFCTVGLLSFPLSSPLSLDLSLHRLRSAYQLLRNQAPRPSSATMCRDARQPLRCFRCLHPQCFEVQHTETLSDSHDF